MAGFRRGNLLTLGLMVVGFALAWPWLGQKTAVGGPSKMEMPKATPTARMGLPACDGGVHVLGHWADANGGDLWSALQPFVRQAGLKVTFESTPDVESVLAARLDEGIPPDIAILPGTALLQTYARSGQLVPLDQVLDVDRLREQYPEPWLRQASVEGRVYGLLAEVVNESLVWYSPREFRARHWSVPGNWNEMLALTEQIARAGLAPWALGLPGQADSGRRGTDWIENIVLQSSGPEVYDRWVRHEMAWNDPAVRQAFQRWGRIVEQLRYRSDGGRAIPQISRAGKGEPLFQPLRGAAMCLEDSLALPAMARSFGPQAAGEAYDFFPLPSLRSEDSPPVVAGADVVVMFRPKTEAVALVRYLSSREAQVAEVQRGGLVAPRWDVTPADYPDRLSRQAARQVQEAEVVRLDASEQMPPAVEARFQEAVQEFVVDPGRLDEILAAVEMVARQAYPAAEAREAQPRQAAPGGGLTATDPAATPACAVTATGAPPPAEVWTARAASPPAPSAISPASVARTPAAGACRGAPSEGATAEAKPTE